MEFLPVASSKGSMWMSEAFMDRAPRMMALTSFSTSGAEASTSEMSDLASSLTISMPSPDVVPSASFLAMSATRRFMAAPSPLP